MVLGNSAPWSVPVSSTPISSVISVPSNSTNCPGGIDLVINGLTYPCIGGAGSYPIVSNCPDGLTGIKLNGTLVCGVIGRNLFANESDCEFGGFEFISNTLNKTLCYDDPNEEAKFDSLLFTTNLTSYELSQLFSQFANFSTRFINSSSFDFILSSPNISGSVRVTALDANVTGGISLVSFYTGNSIILKKIFGIPGFLDFMTTSDSIQLVSYLDASNLPYASFNPALFADCFLTNNTVQSDINECLALRTLNFANATSMNLTALMARVAALESYNASISSIVATHTTQIGILQNNVAMLLYNFSNIPLFSYNISSTVDGKSLISSSTSTSTVLKSFTDTTSLAFSSTTTGISGDVTITATDVTSGFASILTGCSGNNCNFRQLRAYDPSILDVQQDSTTVFFRNKLNSRNLLYPNVSISLYPDCPFAASEADIDDCLAARTVGLIANYTNAANVIYTPSTPFRGQTNYSVASALKILFDNRLPSFTKIWYVDVINGDDVLGDGSPLNPFKTIGKTFSVIGTFLFLLAQQVHVAIGTYVESSLLWPPNTFVISDDPLRVVIVNVNGSVTLRSDWATAGPHVEGGVSNLYLSATNVTIDYTIMGPAPPSSIAKFSMYNTELDAPYIGSGRGSTDLFHFLISDLDLPININCGNAHFERNLFTPAASTILTDNACSAPQLEWHILFNYFDLSNFTASQSTSTSIITDGFLNGWDRGSVLLYGVTPGAHIFNTFTMPLNIFVQSTVVANYNLNLAAAQLCGLDVTYWGTSCLNGAQIMMVLMGRAKDVISSGTGQVTLIKSSTSTTITFNELSSTLSSLLLTNAGNGTILLSPNLLLTPVGGGVSLINTGTADAHVIKTFFNSPSLQWFTNSTSIYADINFSVTTSGNGGTSLISSTTGQTLVTKELFAIGITSIINNATGIYIVTPLGVLLITAGLNMVVTPGSGTGNYTIATTANPVFSSGTFSATSSQLTFGTTTTTTLSVPTPTSSRTHTLNDPGTNSAFVMTDGTQTINGAKTFSTAIGISSGGTGVSSLTAFGLVGVNSGGTAFTSTTFTNGQIPIGSTGSGIVAAVPTGTTDQVTVTASAGGLAFSTPAVFKAPGTIQDTTGMYYSTSNAVSAAGATQGTATALTTSYNVITTVAASTGVALPTPARAGLIITISNRGANPLNVYPASGAAIDSLATNIPVIIPTGMTAIYEAASTTLWYTFLSPNRPVQRLYAATASVTIASTATITTMISATGDGSLTIPANTLRVGSEIQMYASGIVSCLNADTGRIDVLLGGTVITTFAATDMGPLLTNVGFTVRATIIVRSTGAGGTAIGEVQLVTAGGGSVLASRTTATSALDTTIDRTLDMQFKYSTASASNTMTIVSFTTTIIY